MTQPIFLPDIKTSIINGEEHICMAGLSSVMCNVATGRMEGDQPGCREKLLAMADHFNRTGYASVLKAAETNDQALGALLRETKVLLQLAAEKNHRAT
jgi:hypothetical protein